jgi:hypothetical protein
VADEPEEPVPEAPQAPQLGDFIASVTKAVGIKPCSGCRKRQEYLNQLSTKMWNRVRRR